ncbi:LacI family transcriptional regulator [Thalassobacillus devorans]|uniref:LacI family transcriptional regulator n=1 Tax=Thalassobacillus devorans TaxID=279813 RepID=A0ABQ1NQU0_9BACI|nr:LacI family DNA-binding transcriptional regulator [Thalassobacillus devorans]NIK28841.1 LacI family sucrose operon transcriptional repressor [Thalassobacillus devorans]GGC83139.1 LacI family transcriptional regulator [Thalassobacillus devorans]
MTTINDIAKMANVSRTTVSRVLNNNGYVSESARKRVMQVVEETGYIPSVSAKSLRTKRSGVIGVILPKISTETASRVVGGINEVVSKEGFQILLTDTELHHEKEIEYIRLLQSRHVDGIILLATNVNDPLLHAIEEAKLPFISLGQELPGVTSIVYDDYHAAVDMTTMILQKGHKKIAYIGVGEEDPAVGVLRKKGFMDTMKKAGITVEENWCSYGDFSIESGYESMKQIINSNRENSPTAVFVVTDRMAIGAMEYLKEQGFRIPEDMAITGIGAAVMSKYITPSLTTIDYFNKDAGSKAAELLLEQLQGKNTRKKITQNYRLIKRDSV